MVDLLIYDCLLHFPSVVILSPYHHGGNKRYSQSYFIYHSVLSLVKLKLVLLEWSQSKSDCKFGFNMLKNPLVQIFRAIGATSGVWQHIAIFAWWHVQVIFNSSSIKLYTKIINLFSFIVTLFWKKFLCNIISRTLN